MLQELRFQIQRATRKLLILPVIGNFASRCAPRLFGTMTLVKDNLVDGNPPLRPRAQGRPSREAPILLLRRGIKFVGLVKFPDDRQTGANLGFEKFPGNTYFSKQAELSKAGF